MNTPREFRKVVKVLHQFSTRYYYKRYLAVANPGVSVSCDQCKQDLLPGCVFFAGFTLQGSFSPVMRLSEINCRDCVKYYSARRELELHPCPADSPCNVIHMTATIGRKASEEQI